MALQVLVGADPEIFMFDQAGKPVSAHGAIQGDKKNPFKVEHGAVQVDGMALEFNIDPASSKEEFSRNIQAVLATLTSMVPGYTLKSCPVAEFGAEYIKAQPMEALELGCEPDFDAYTNGGVNPRPNGQVPFRTAAGHVHIGWGASIPTDDPVHLEACVMASKQLDWSLGLGSLLFDGGPEGRKRRQLYGAPGCFRPKSYGVEYRTLSNAWLQSKALMEWVFEVTQKSMSDLSEGIAYGQHGGEARTIITGVFDTRTIEDYFKRSGCPLPPGYNSRTKTFNLA
jgi:hypothetical protein